MSQHLRTIIASWVVAAILPATARAGVPTYHREVERILRKNCQECHRPGQVAPFSLLTYEQARKRGEDLRDVTHDRRMPPWPASMREGGPFRNARVLDQGEIDTLAAWVEAGCPEGDPSDAPAPPAFDDGWPLGPPDLVLKLPEPYDLAAEGADEQRVFVIPTGLTEGRWVAAVDYKPGNPKVVHHVLGGFDLKKRARVLDQADPRPGYKAFGGFGIMPDGFMSGWAPGRKGEYTPLGIGRYLPANADFLIQVHYHRSGKPEADATRVGLYFAKTAIDKELGVEIVAPPTGRWFFLPDLKIPAGASNHEVKGSVTLGDADRHMLGVVPHMHWLGKDFAMTATFPDGSSRTLIKVDRWDFNWQGLYDLAEPIALPKGTRIDMVAHFDNSAANPFNPNSPPLTVGWGEQTTDEMCLGFLYLSRDDQHLANQPPRRFRPRAGSTAGPAQPPAGME